MLDRFIHWFNVHPEVSLLLGIIGLLLTIYGVIITIRSATKISLSYSITGNNLIQDFTEKLNGLELKFKDQNVRNLTITKMVIWNSGNASIRKTDLVESDRLRICVPNDINILDFDIIQVNESSNEFNLTVNAQNVIETKEVRVNFNYIDKKQGCVLQILHNSPDYRAVSLTGKIIGVGKLKKVKYKDPKNYLSNNFRFFKPQKMTKIGLSIIVLTILLPIILFLYVMSHPIDPKPLNENFQGAFRILWYTYVILTPLLILSILFSNITPKGLDKFEEQL